MRAVYTASCLLLALSLATACQDPEEDRVTPGDERAEMGRADDGVADGADAMDQAPDAVADMAESLADMNASDLGERDGAEEMPPTLEPVPDPVTYASCAPYAVRGPFEVGVTTITRGGAPIEIWYPAAAAGEEKDVYNLRDWLSPEYREKISEDAPTTFITEAYRDVEIAAGGPWPLVIFSHGYAGYRLQSTALTTHMASWGFVVVSTEHEERWLPSVLAEDLSGVGNGDNAEVLAGVFAQMAEENNREGGPLAKKIDLEHVGLVGHSAGGAAIINVSSDERYDAIVGFTPAVKSFDGAELEDAALPGFYISATNDKLTRARDIKAYYERQPLGEGYVAIEKAGHLAPTDICVIGREQGGVLEIAEEAGLEVPFLLKVLAQDGCRRSDLRAEISWPIFQHFAVAHLRAQLLGDASGDGLDEAATACFGALVSESSLAPK